MLKKIHSIVSSFPIIHSNTLLLAVRASEYYYISTGLVLQSILPNTIAQHSAKTQKILADIKPSQPPKQTTKQPSQLLIQSTPSEPQAGVSIYPSATSIQRHENSELLAHAPHTTHYWIDGKATKDKYFTGPRKYVFLPIHPPASVTINNENSGLYEINQRNPKIDARVIARIRNQTENLPLVSIDSVPSLAMYHFFKSNNLSIHHEKPNLSRLRIIDMREEKNRPNQSLISQTLHRKLKTLQEDEQAIIFVHRKGLASALLCQFCGYIFKCRDCDIPFALHDNFLLCHRCMKKMEPAPQQCVLCNSVKIRNLGGGTNRVEKTLQNILPTASIATIDGETTKTQKEKHAILKQFADKQYNILIGTKTLIHNYNLLPTVQWAALLDIDTMINIPYYNASEEAFKAIWRLREKTTEETLLQTHTPDISLFRDSQKDTVIPFLENQLSLRETMNAPPFSQEIQLVYEDKNEYDVRNKAIQLHDALARFIDKNNNKDATIMGPAPAYQKKRKGYFRWYLVIQYRHSTPDQTIDTATRNKLLSIIPRQWQIIINPTQAP